MMAANCVPDAPLGLQNCAAVDVASNWDHAAIGVV